MASRHICAETHKQQKLSTYAHVQMYTHYILVHLHNNQCDESDQESPGLRREIEEVAHLYVSPLFPQQ